MRISLVVAMDRQRVIGAGGALPWHLPADLKHFREITMGKPIVMGRRTYESINRALPGRRNIVVSRNPAWPAPPGCERAHSLEHAVQLAGAADEVMVIGGAALYRAALPRAQRIYLTEVHATVDGDVHFPPISPEQWRETERVERPADDRNPYSCSFVVLERIRG